MQWVYRKYLSTVRRYLMLLEHHHVTVVGVLMAALTNRNCASFTLKTANLQWKICRNTKNYFRPTCVGVKQFD